MPYDATLTALFQPERAASPLLDGPAPQEIALATEAARLAYYRWDERPTERQRLQEALARAGFDGLQCFEHEATDGQGFGALRAADGLVLLAFRGTQVDRRRDLVIDARSWLVGWSLDRGGDAQRIGRVHAGFAATSLGLWEAVKPWLAQVAPQRRRLLVCGHSLGGAIATLLALPAGADRLVSIGSPRVGDAAFVARLLAQVPDVQRFVDCCDLVARVPPPLLFRHAGARRYIDRHGLERPGIGSLAVFADRTAARLNYLWHHAWRRGNVPVRMLADHAPHNYRRALWAEGTPPT